MPTKTNAKAIKERKAARTPRTIAPVVATKSEDSAHAREPDPVPPPAVWEHVSKLVPWIDNPRKNAKAVPKVAASIAYFGFGNPILARKENREIVGGHTRLLAMHFLLHEPEKLDDNGRIVAGPRFVAKGTPGPGMVPVRYLDLNEADAHLLAVADNKLGEIAEWEDHALARELSKHGLPDAELAGFGRKELEKLGAAMMRGDNPSGSDAEGDAGDEPVPDVPAVPRTQQGDLWLLGEHRLLCGDSFKLEDRERLLDGQLADLITTDPPYAIYGSSTGIGADIADDKMIRPFFEQFFRACSSHIREFGHVYVCCDWRSWSAITETSKRAGLSTKNCLVWDKGGGGLGSSYAQCYELIGFFSKLAPPTAMRSTTRTGQRTVMRPNILRFTRASGDERQHNAAKPIPMIVELMVNSSDEGALVLDFFGGSGMTIIAAEKTKRRGYAMEIEPKWCDVIVARWEKLTGKTAERRAPHA